MYLRRGKWRARIAVMFAVTAGVGAACGSGGESSSSGGKSVEFRMQSTAPKDDLWTQMVQRFADGVEESSDGRIKIKVYCCGQLATDTVAELEAVKSGQLGGLAAVNTALSNFDERAVAFSLPFLANSPKQIHAVLDGPGVDVWKETLASVDIVAVPGASTVQGFRQLTTSNRRVVAPDDLKGLDIRAIPVPLASDIFKELGANPISLPFSDLAGALQTGAVDGQENPLTLIRTGGLADIQKHLTLWNYSVTALNFGFNKKLWDGLTPEDRDLLTNEAIKAAKWHREAYPAADLESLEKMRKNFDSIDELSPAQVQAFRTALQPVSEKWSKKVGSDIADAFRKAAGN